MHSFMWDIRFAVRRLLQRPAATLLALLMLSLGIGMMAVFYLLIRGSINDLPPLPAVDRVARVWIADDNLKDDRIPPSPSEWLAWRGAPASSIALAPMGFADQSAEIGGRATQISVQFVTDAYFDVLDVRPQVGRTFTPADMAVVIVSHRLWSQLDNASRQLGSTLLIEHRRFEIVGVMPASFWFPSRGSPDAVLPWTSAPKGIATQTVGRLTDGVSAESAAAALSPGIRGLLGSGRSARVVPLTYETRKRLVTGLAFLLGPSLLVLVSVCVNIGALLLGNMLLREKDLAIRAAMGAGPWRLGREAITEALLLTTVGGFFAMVCAFWSIALLKHSALAANPSFLATLPPWLSAWPIVVCAMAVTTFGSALAPALFASRTNINSAMAGRLRRTPRRRGQYGLGELILVLQVAIAAGLLVWLSMVFQLIRQLGQFSPNVAAERVWMLEITVPEESQSRTERMLSAALDRARSWPAVEVAALSDSIPTPEGPRSRTLAWRAHTEAGNTVGCSAALAHVTGSYFRAVGVEPRGRLPSDAHEVLVNSLAVERCGAPSVLRTATGETGVLAVVGVVNDRVADGPVFPPRPVVYAPFSFRDSRRAALLVRVQLGSRFDSAAFVETVRRDIPDLVLSDPVILAAWLRTSLTGARSAVSIFACIAVLALVLGLVGLHAALGQAVGMRTREIGVQLALGASTRDVLVATLGHQATAALVGVVLGASVAFIGTRTIGGPFGSSGSSPELWLTLMAILSLGCAVSTAVPVFRIVRVDPAVVLRNNG